MAKSRSERWFPFNADSYTEEQATLFFNRYGKQILNHMEHILGKPIKDDSACVLSLLKEDLLEIQSRKITSVIY